MEGGSVWVSPLLLFATTRAGATIRGMSPRGWAKPGLPGSCCIGVDSSFWGDGSVPCGVSLISFILPW